MPLIPSRVSECNKRDFVFNRKSVTLSSNVIGLKTQYFLLIRFLSRNRTVWSRKVYINRTNKLQLKLHFKFTSQKLYYNHHGNANKVSEAEILNKITKWRNRGRPILLTLMVTDWFRLIVFTITDYFLLYFFFFFFLLLFHIQQVFKTIVNANTYNFNSDISKEASKLSTLR